MREGATSMQCPYCNARSDAVAGRCATCGRELATGAVAELGQTLYQETETRVDPPLDQTLYQEIEAT